MIKFTSSRLKLIERTQVITILKIFLIFISYCSESSLKQLTMNIQNGRLEWILILKCELKLISPNEKKQKNQQNKKQINK